MMLWLTWMALAFLAFSLIHPKTRNSSLWVFYTVFVVTCGITSAVDIARKASPYCDLITIVVLILALKVVMGLVVLCHAIFETRPRSAP
jgi:hypothetical protein